MGSYAEWLRDRRAARRAAEEAADPKLAARRARSRRKYARRKLRSGALERATGSNKPA